MSLPNASASSRPAHLPKLQIGWPFDPRPEAGGMGFPTLDRSIRDQIKIILMTQPGELLLHPGFGAGLQALLHEPNTLATRRRLRDLVVKAISQWEPRIVLDQTDVWELPERPDAVRVELAYRIKRTGAAQQFTFDLVLGA
ncbi:MAG: GPW/gp25 family protein [Mangrovicoccus sp.]